MRQNIGTIDFRMLNAMFLKAVQVHVGIIGNRKLNERERFEVYEALVASNDVRVNVNQ